MSGAGKGAPVAVRLFDAHCHLQDPRIFSVAPQLIRRAQESGVLRDVEERSPNWLSSMKEFFDAVPCAAVGEVGLDKGSHGKLIDFSVQIEVLQQQLDFAKEVERPVSIHCVRAYGDLLEVLQSDGPFPAGLLLHSYLGSAEMVPAFAKHGAYFSFSGYLTTMKPQKARKMLKMVPIDRILLESDAPDGFPRLGECSFSLVPGDASIPQEKQIQTGDINADTTKLPKETLNHPANVSTKLVVKAVYLLLLLVMGEWWCCPHSYWAELGGARGGNCPACRQASPSVSEAASAVCIGQVIFFRASRPCGHGARDQTTTLSINNSILNSIVHQSDQIRSTQTG